MSLTFGIPPVLADDRELTNKEYIDYVMDQINSKNTFPLDTDIKWIEEGDMEMEKYEKLSSSENLTK